MFPWETSIFGNIISYLLKRRDAAKIPRPCGAKFGRDGAAGSRFERWRALLRWVIFFMALLFAIVRGGEMPQQLSALLGVLHLFTHVGMI